jgi:hypothetical protein
VPFPTQILNNSQGSFSEPIQSIEFSYYSRTSVDAGPLGTGATIAAGQTSQSTGYPIAASSTIFTTVTPAVTGSGNTPTAAAILPLMSGPNSLVGVTLYVTNNGAQPINLYPNLGDLTASINGQAANLPIVLGVGTITAIVATANLVWMADGVGEGASGSIATTVSQGSIAAAGSSQSTATPITQGMAMVTMTASSGVALPPAKAGMQILVQPPISGSAFTLSVYPVNGGSDAINALSANGMVNDMRVNERLLLAGISDGQSKNELLPKLLRRLSPEQNIGNVFGDCPADNHLGQHTMRSLVGTERHVCHRHLGRIEIFVEGVIDGLRIVPAILGKHALLDQIGHELGINRMMKAIRLHFRFSYSWPQLHRAGDHTQSSNGTAAPSDCDAPHRHTPSRGAAPTM